MVQLSHSYMTPGKITACSIHTFVSKVISLLFNTLSSFVIALLPRGKYVWISWLQSPFIVILESQNIKSVTVFTFSPSNFHEEMGLDAMILVFWMLRFKPDFLLSSLTLIKRLFSSSSLFVLRVVSLAYLSLLTFLPAILIPACESSSPAFLMMYSTYKLNKQGDNIQLWRTPFPIWETTSLVSCPVLTGASLPAFRFFRRQVRWSRFPISLRIFHSLLWSTESKALAQSMKQK